MDEDYVEVIDDDGEPQEVIVEEEDYMGEGDEFMEEDGEYEEIEYVDEEELGEEDEQIIPENLEPLDQPFVEISAHTDSVYCISFNPQDEFTLLTGSGDDKGYLWDIGSIKDDKEVDASFAKATISNHTETVAQVQFSQDGAYFATGGLDSVVHIWKTETGELLHRLGGDDPEVGVSSMTWFQKHPVIFYGLEDGSGWLWNAEKGKLMNTFYGHGETINACSFNPAGNRIITASDDGSIKVWSPAKGQLLYTISGHGFHEQGVTSLKCHSNDKIVISGGQDGTICISNIQTGKSLSKLEGHTESVEDIDFALDYKWAVSSSVDGDIAIWDMGTTQQRQRISNNKVGITRMRCIDNVVVATDFDGYIKFWDVRNGELFKQIHAHSDAILDMDISKSRKFIATASDDQRACIFPLEDLLKK